MAQPQHPHQHEHPQQPRRSKRANGCIELLMVEGAIVVLMCTAFPLGIWIHTTRPQLEVFGTILATFLGLTAAAAWIRSRRRRDKWVSGTISAELLFLGCTLAVFHGWQTQVEVLYLLTSVVYLVVIIVASTRLNRRIRRSLCPADDQHADPDPRAGEPVSWPAVQAQLATDPHPIVIYPSK